MTVEDRAPVPARAAAPPHPDDEAPGSIAPAAIAYLLLGASIAAWFPYYSVFFQELGVPVEEIGLIAAISAAAAMVAAPAWGSLADRLGDVRPPLLAASLWAAVLAAWLVTGPTGLVLLVSAALLAAGSAALQPLLDARTVQRLGRDRDRYGHARVWASISFIGVSIAVGAVIDATSPHAVPILYAPLLAATGIVGALVLGRSRRPPRVASRGGFAAWRLLQIPGLGLFFVGSVVVWAAATASTTYFSLRLLELGADGGLVGIAWAVNAVVEVPMMFAFPALARRVRVQPLIVLGALVFGIRAVGWAVAGSAEAAVLVATLGGFAFAPFLVGTTSHVAARAPAGTQATAQGLFAGTAFSLGSILGALLGGVVAGAFGLQSVYVAGAVTAFVGAAIVWLAIVRRTEPAASTTPSRSTAAG